MLIRARFRLGFSVHTAFIYVRCAVIVFCVYLAEGGEVRKTEPVGKVEFNDQVM